MKISYGLILLCIVLFFSCSNNDDFIEPTTTRPSDYNAKYFPIVKNTLNYYKSKLINNKALNDRNIQSHSIKWGLTSILQKEDGHLILFVPIFSDLSRKVHYSLSIKINREKEIEEIYFMESNPNELYYLKNRYKLYYESFSGIVNIYDLDNKLLKSQNYNNGNILLTKGVNDDNLLNEVIIYGKGPEFVTNWELWAHYIPIDPTDFICPMCGSSRNEIGFDNYNMYCKVCGYGLSGGGGSGGLSGNMYNGWDVSSAYGPLGDQYPWSDLTSDEKRFVIDYPHIAKVFYDNAKKAALAVLSMPGQHNGEADAVRHAYWNALNARDHGDLAKRYGDAHESNPAQPNNERAMDLHNNAIGYIIGLQGRGDAITPSWTDQQIWNEVIKAKSDGKLQLGLK